MRLSEDRGRYPGWVLLACVTLGCGSLLDAAGLAAAYLFSGLLIGVVVALCWPGRLVMHGRPVSAALALTGAALGTQLTLESVTGLGSTWIAVLLIAAVTILLSVATGVVLSRTTDIDAPTAALGMIAGGGPTAVVMADEFGADPRLVAFMQYIRVLAIAGTMPVLAAVIASSDSSLAPAVTAGPPIEAADWLLTLAVVAGGVVVAGIARRPSMSLLAALVLSIAVLLAPRVGEFHVPSALRVAAFAILGLDVGLRFTREAVRHIRSVLRPVLAAMAALLVACCLLGVLLSITTTIPFLDAYLATTPGGLSAVVAVTLGSGADPTVVFTAQTLRVLAAVTLAPMAVPFLVRFHEAHIARKPVAR